MSQENLKIKDEGQNEIESSSKESKVLFDGKIDEYDENGSIMLNLDESRMTSEEFVEEEYDEEHYEDEIDESLNSELSKPMKKINIQIEDKSKTVIKAKHKITLMTPSLLKLEEDKHKDKTDGSSLLEAIEFAEEFSFDEEFSGEIDEEQEELIEEEALKDEFVDRDAYLEIYQRLTEEKKLLRRRNGYLHRKMTEHLKKRNLESLLKEPSYVDSADIQEKYEKKLISLAKKLEWHTAQKEKLTEELELMGKQVDEEQSMLEATFRDFLKREREISVGLIDTSTGQPISDRLFNRLLNLQKQKFDTIGEIRLECIRLRDKVNKKEKILESIETIGDNLHLVDYEYLCIENQNFTDKNEERDEELSKLHNKSAASIQILAHIRQKSYATAVDFQVMEEKLKEVETQLSETRENLNTLKMQRDNYRSEAIRIKESSGLLTQMKLLHDFEYTNDEIIKARAELELIKQKFENEKEELYQLQSLLNAFGDDKKNTHQ